MLYQSESVVKSLGLSVPQTNLSIKLIKFS